MFCFDDKTTNKRTYMQEYINDFDIWAPAKTSDILEQLHQDIDTWYYHETLRNDRGDTKNDDSWYTCLPDFIANMKSSGTMRDTQKTMTISATSFPGCNRFSLLLIYHYNRCGFMMFHVVSWQRCPSYLSTCPEWGCKELFLPIDLLGSLPVVFCSLRWFISPSFWFVSRTHW